MSDAGSRALDEQPKHPDSSYVVSPVPTKLAPPARAKRRNWLRAVISSPFVPLVIAAGDSVVLSALIYAAFWRPFL